jgi:hypothetical protein
MVPTSLQMGARQMPPPRGFDLKAPPATWIRLTPSFRCSAEVEVEYEPARNYDLDAAPLV